MRGGQASVFRGTANQSAGWAAAEAVWCVAEGQRAKVPQQDATHARESAREGSRPGTGNGQREGSGIEGRRLKTIEDDCRARLNGSGLLGAAFAPSCLPTYLRREPVRA